MSGSENKSFNTIRYVACQIEGCEEYSNMDAIFFKYTTPKEDLSKNSTNKLAYYFIIFMP